MSAIPLREPTKPCIGRDDELRTLRRKFEEGSRQGERLALIRGPAGVGKTRLMVEFRSQMRLDGAVLLEGRCTAGARALTPLREILRRALSFLEEVGRDSDLDLGPLAFLLSDSPPLEPVIPGATRLEQRVQFFEAYCSLLRGLSRIKPPVILVHDLQWADTATVELLTHLLDGAGPWLEAPSNDRTMMGLIVASVRDDEEPAAIRQLVSHPKTETIDLAGFDEAAMTKFLQSPAVVQRLLRSTGGNPEDLLALIESPVIDADRMLERRLERMDHDARQLLSALAVLGRPSEAGVVARVAGVTNAARSLASLLEAGLVVKSVQDGEVLLRPTRHRYSDVLYGSLGARERQTFHQRAVVAFQEARGPAAQDVAFHAIRAGEDEIAVEAALEAARELEHTFAFEAATSLLEDARALARADNRIELEKRLAELHNHTGDYNRALVCAKSVLLACPDKAEALLTVGRLQTLSGDYDAAHETLGRVVTGEDEALSAELDAARAEVHFRRGEYDDALEICARSASGPNAVALLALRNTQGKIELARGEYAGARATFEQNLTTALDSELVREQAVAQINLGIVCLREHEHTEATHHLDEALKLARRVGALRESAIALENLAVLAHFRRDYGTALDCYHAAVADLKKLGNRAMLARAANNLGELYLRLGDRVRATKLAEFAAHVAGDDPPGSILAEGQLLRARVSMASGERTAARKSLDQAVEIFARLGEKTRLVEAELALASLDLDRGDVTSARKRLQELRSGDGLDQVRRGEAALLEADLERASFGTPLRAVLVAIDCFDRAGDPERSWRAHLRAARLLRETGDTAGARRHLERATAIEAQVSATVPPTFAAGLRDDEDRRILREQLAELTGIISDTGVASEPPPPRRSTAPPSPIVSRPVTASACPDDGIAKRFPDIVFRSPPMHQVLELVERVAPTDSIVLIRGESGTGKELIADAIHRLSHRAARPFVKVNCAALVETLLLSELFGHEKGAFTGATQRRKGRFEAADGGTLFLDEIGDVSPKTQVSLLRVLQEQQFERVGGSSPIRTDVRIICATNRDLEALVAEGIFREDLYYRLKGIQLSIPPLRQRPDDVETLARHFLDRASRERGELALDLSQEAERILLGHGWPGNVRELENVMRSASLFADGHRLEATHLLEFTELGPPEAAPSPAPRTATPPPPTPQEWVDAAAPPPEPQPNEAPPPAEPLDVICTDVLSGDLSLADMKKKVEQECIQAALQRTDGNITQAASLLGMKRPRLSQLVKEHGLRQSERRVKP